MVAGRLVLSHNNTPKDGLSQLDEFSDASRRISSSSYLCHFPNRTGSIDASKQTNGSDCVLKKEIPASFLTPSRASQSNGYTCCECVSRSRSGGGRKKLHARAMCKHLLTPFFTCPTLTHSLSLSFLTGKILTDTQMLFHNSLRSSLCSLARESRLLSRFDGGKRCLPLNWELIAKQNYSALLLSFARPSKLARNNKCAYNDYLQIHKTSLAF